MATPRYRKIVHFVLHSDASIKALLIGIIVLLCSSLRALELVPDTFLSDKDNIFNVYLAKFSWLWTILFLFPTLTIITPLYTGFVFSDTLRHLSRLAVAHAVWYFTTSFMATLSKHVRLDISGHVFLLTYCVLIITEEAVNVKVEVWKEFDCILTLEHQVLAKKVWLKPLLLKMYNLVDYVVEPLELYGLSLVLVWTSIILSTSLYFHTVMEKVMGYVLAVGMWWVTYRILYGRSKYLPCKPTHGVLHPTRHLTIL